ncbi:Fe(2+) transporter permease subunit FeoB [Mesosutterella sp. OilRF-GAM-744-9]|uniref:Ferrous iron transport protein B n=1 Tax=Mesosutterella porci TaxID=2915351 RepID=A0ABS9MSG2_9BURK|nr:Fe(2+) transporter permease subunit FeoB [Mesosutterella sp. oilRF-744-WT-GAM-9]MCG5030938.1 Fe(2+) transporter permease subunit FeoB [Mesosutterella sp. oilRF-744-WT-GAM-9]
MAQHRICIVGNPNCGKTTLFNAMTGSRQEVGNWPGVTVEKKSGFYRSGNREIELVDLPGIYSVTPSRATGEDERIARNYLVSGEAEAVVNIVDASNLERNLYLTTQLTEMRIPMIVVLNMMDIARQHKLSIDLEALSASLGCPVLSVVASRGTGVEALKHSIDEMLEKKTVPPLRLHYPTDIEGVISLLGGRLERAGQKHGRWNATQILEGAEPVEPMPAEIEADLAEIRKPLDHYGEDLDIEIANARYQLVSDIIARVVHRKGEIGATITDKIDRVVLNRWLGIPIFLFMMYLMFVFAINVGSAFIDFFDILVGGVLVDGFGGLLESLGTPGWLKTLLADGVGGGIQTVSTFIPPVTCLFLFLSILEDSGYMARAAFVMDRFLRAVGLPGRAFIPMIVGFGCGVPAIMSTRTMNRESDRIMTAMMVPFMSCGARLPVYVLFGAAFFAGSGSLLIFTLYLIGIIVAIITGWLLKKNTFPGDNASFIMEIPPYHIPTLKGVLTNTWERLRAFIKRAGIVITGVVVAISFLNSWGTDGTFGHEDSDSSVLSAIGKTIIPAFAPMGLQPDNWPASVGIFTGVLAKESVIGTLNSLYGAAAERENAHAGKAEEEKPDEPWSFTDTLQKAVGSIGENLSGLGDQLANPFLQGTSIGDLSDTEAAVEEAEGTMTTVTMMQKLFVTKTAAFAYLLMVLLYMPCCAAIGTIWREVGTRWTIFACVWTTGVGYSAATIFYQLSTFASHPAYSVECLAGVLVFLAVMIFWMRSMKKKADEKGPRIIPIRLA